MTLNQLTGLPVVWQGSMIGQVEHGVLDTQMQRLMGLVIRRGLGAAKWVPSRGISLMGRRCVVIQLRPFHMPDALPTLINRVYLTNGCLAGLVTDALLHRETLQVVALEIGESLLSCLMGQRRYAVAYQVGLRDGRVGRNVVSELLSLAAFSQRFKEEWE